ncbi:hypothetical protein EJ05DRAFT_473296 [Pseudovirgaria hyperparasitica]|uniref:Uncharacterized protein n=1 Tax=Pseudovirgaria hyperparasitica TaxID=470096 RepID=A0A6A6WHV1_9PEZI|nr:uncharacterized protein EJ05DRAFT_473296 [Pseudovirgaria hyperparasitica]KAF2762382.1 hypothetical protein EJ05DRAFT_473296 [Pseudovirgaria hyperparasitica]
MPSKRPHSDTDGVKPDKKKHKKGFQVGPANLPDGTHKRQVQKIKNDLIAKAKLRKQYAKIRERELANQPPNRYIHNTASDNNENDSNNDEQAGAQDTHHEPAAASSEPHPDRQKLLLEEDATTTEPQDDDASKPSWKRQKRPKPVPFAREAEQAQKRKQEAEERRLAREEAEKERQRKIAERERFRRAMAKARTGGPNGQRKLGRESQVLLEKVKRMVDA